MAGNKAKTSVGMIILWFLFIILGIVSFILYNDSSFQTKFYTSMNKKLYFNLLVIGIFILSIIGTSVTTFRITSRRWVFPKALVITVLTVYLMLFSFVFVEGSANQIVLIKQAGYLTGLIVVFYFIYISISEYKKK